MSQSLVFNGQHHEVHTDVPRLLQSIKTPESARQDCASRRCKVGKPVGDMSLQIRD